MPGITRANINSGGVQANSYDAIANRAVDPVKEMNKRNI